MSKIRVLIVDDSSFMRSMLERMIIRDERFEVVGQAVNGAEGVELTKLLKPNVITMDVEMPVMTGLQALEKIMAECPTPVVMISTLTEAGARTTLDALEKGAVDFLAKALNDTNQNIFQSSGSLHEKLAAAASASVRGTVRSPAAPSVEPSSLSVERPGMAGATPPSGLHSAAIPAPTAPQAFRVPSSFTAASTSGVAPVFGQPKPVTQETAPAQRAPVNLKTLGSFGRARLLLVATSTGGPRALQSVIPALRGGLRVPVVVAQHMPPNFTATMAARLNESSQVTVKEAADGEKLVAGTVYVAPGGMLTALEKNGTDVVIRVRADTKNEYLYHPSVDFLAASAAEAYGGDVLAVMMTGMGNDGAASFGILKEKGAYVLAQDEASCVVYGMPKAVADRHIANEVLDLESLAPAVNRLLL